MTTHTTLYFTEVILMISNETSYIPGLERIVEGVVLDESTLVKELDQFQ